MNDLSKFEAEGEVRPPARRRGLIRAFNNLHGARLVITLCAAGFLLFLVSDGARFITGQTLPVDGGAVMVR